MATVHLHLQNVPPEAGAQDIRGFFSHFHIPNGGVQIVGGPKGEAFVTFSNYEDLLKATSYDRSYLMGRQLLMNLVNGEEVERIIDNMKHELVARIRPMEMLRRQQTSQTRELPASWGMAASRDYTPPVEFPSRSTDHQWQKRHLDPAPPTLAEYSSSSMYAGGETKRMRPSSQELDEGRYYNSTSTFSADSGSENLQMELEMELRRAQEIKEQLNRNKEKIKRLKQGIIEEDDVTVPRTNPVVGEAQTPQMTDSRAGSLRWQSQLQAEQSRHQYQTEKVTVKPEAYQDYCNTPRYQSEGQETYQNFSLQPMQEPPKFDRAQRRFEQPQPAAYGSQGNWYNDEVANWPGPTPCYGDQRYSGQNEGYNQGSASYPGPSPYGDQSYGGHNEGYNRKDPMYPVPSPNYKDQQPPGMNPEYWDKKIKKTKKQRKTERQERRWGDNPFGPGGSQWKPNPPEEPVSAPPQSKMGTQKPATSKSPKELKTSEGQRPSADMSRVKGVSSPHFGSIKQALYFTALRSLPEDATASSVWKSFGGPTGRSVGVLLLNKKGLAACREAYVAYERYYDQNSEMSCHKWASDCMDRGVYTRFANASPESEMYKTTPTGEDEEVSDNEKAMLRQKFLLNSSWPRKTHLPEKERESEQLILNEISRSLFDVNQQVNIPDSEACASEPCYLRLDCLPPEITAHEVWDWFGAATGPCLRVTLIKLYGKKARFRTKVAYVAFRDHNSCNAETYKYNRSQIMTEKEAVDEMAKAGSIVIESTDKFATKGELEKQVDLKAGASVHILKIRDVGRKPSCSKMWMLWFGGRGGPAQGVTAIDNGRTRTAFVAFRDPMKCKAEKVRHLFSEVISETEMLKLFAHCPLDNKIMSSHASGDRTMSRRERADLKARFYPTDAEDKEKVKTFEHTSVTNKDKQTDLKGKCDSDEEHSNANGEKEGKKSNHTSEANIASASKPEENTDRKSTEDNQPNVSDEEEGKTFYDTLTENMATTTSELEENTKWKDTVEKEAHFSYEEKGKKSDHTSVGTNLDTMSEPEENTNREDVTEPKPIADTELTPSIGGTQTKFFLQIPGITKRITAWKVWKWFGGPEGSVSRVTLVPKIGGLSGQAYVEFIDRAARDAALSHYQSSKVMTEQEVFCILAAQACRTSTDILESSVSGVDRAWTVEERELLMKEVYSVVLPEENTDNKDMEDKQETTSAEKGDETPAQTSDRTDGNESRDPEPTEKAQSRDTKFFLWIPNLGKRVTACNVWSWFGGARGPLPGVTLVQQAAGLSKHAYVEFSDPAARNAVKLQYNDSTDLDEQTMLHTLAEACKSNAGIFQSSVTGKDRLLTLIERDLIKNQAFPGPIQRDTPPEKSVPSHSLEEKEVIGEKAHPEGYSSSGTGLSRQATEEEVPMGEELSDEEEALNIDLPSQSGKPRLLQKLDYEYIHLTELKPEVTAFMLSLQYRPCCGVTLIKNALGTSVAAYIAFEPKTNPKANIWQQTRDRELAALGLHYEIYEDTGRLGDRLIPLKERHEFLEYMNRWWKRK